METKPLPIVEELRQERKRQGLTQSEIADRMGTKYPVISFLEAGIRFPSLTTLLGYADALGFDLEMRLRRKS